MFVKSPGDDDDNDHYEEEAKNQERDSAMPAAPKIADLDATAPDATMPVERRPRSFAEAQFNLGVMHEDGEGVLNDEKIAARFYEQAAAQGHAEAQYKLGVMYKSGRGVPKDEDAAARLFEQAATQGHAQAQHDLGVMYHHRNGAPSEQLHF